MVSMKVGPLGCDWQASLRVGRQHRTSDVRKEKSYTFKLSFLNPKNHHGTPYVLKKSVFIY